MPEFVLRILIVSGLTGLLWWFGKAVPDWPGAGGPLTAWLAEFPIVLPVLLAFVFLSVVSSAHERVKRGQAK